jgi:hypothetical protein
MCRPGLAEELFDSQPDGFLTKKIVYIKGVPRGKFNILGVTVSVILRKKSVYVHVSYSETELFYYTVHCTLYRRATLHVLTRLAKCIDVDGGIFENVLY